MEGFIYRTVLPGNCYMYKESLSPVDPEGQLQFKERENVRRKVVLWEKEKQNVLLVLYLSERKLCSS